MLHQLIWYIKRPRLYPQLFRKVRQKLSVALDPSDDSSNTVQWCEERAVSVTDLIRVITGDPPDQSVQALYPEIFEKAGVRVRNCPVQMASYDAAAESGSELDIVTCSGGAGVDLLYRLAEHTQATRVIETGVAYGWSTLSLLLSLRHRQNAILISNDMPYPGVNNDDFVGCAVPDNHLSVRWQLFRYADREGVPKALKELPELDLCHYDSDKSLEGRKWAYPLLWQALRSGGIFISDDVGDNDGFRIFCKTLGMDPLIGKVHQIKDFKYIGILIKQ